MTTDRKFMNGIAHDLARLLDDDENEGVVAKGSAAEAAVKNVINKISNHLKDESSPLHLENLPFEPTVSLLDRDRTVGEVVLVEVPKPYDPGQGWRFVVDCEDALVAIVPGDKAEKWRELLNAIGDEG